MRGRGRAERGRREAAREAQEPTDKQLRYTLRYTIKTIICVLTVIPSQFPLLQLNTEA